MSFSPEFDRKTSQIGRRRQSRQIFAGISPEKMIGDALIPLVVIPTQLTSNLIEKEKIKAKSVNFIIQVVGYKD